MGEVRIERNALDAEGNAVPIVEFQGTYGTADMHHDADLKDPKFYSRFILPDGTKLELQSDKRTLVDPSNDAKYSLQPLLSSSATT